MERRPTPSPVLSKLGVGIRELLDSPEGADLPAEMKDLLLRLDDMLSVEAKPSHFSAEGPPDGGSS